MSSSYSKMKSNGKYPPYDEIDKHLVFASVEHDITPPKKSPKPRSVSLDGKNPILIIGVCGGSGSGKTTLAREIIKRYGPEKVTYISHDYYYRDVSNLTKEQRGRHNFDHPDALETELLIQHLGELRQGRKVEVPLYDFATHARRKETMTLEPNMVILVEGILIFTNMDLVELMDIKIFVETPDDIRFIRRLRRDMMERDRTAESVMEQYMKTVRPMHHTFVEPSKLVADIIIPHGVNPVALDMIISRLQSFADGYIVP